MLRGRLIKWTATLMLFAILNLILGCNQSEAPCPISPTADRADINGGGFDPIKFSETDDYDRGQWPPGPDEGPYELPNGSIVSIDSSQHLATETVLHGNVWYPSVGSEPLHLVVMNNLSGFRIVENGIDTVYRYQIGVSPDSAKVIVTAESDADRLEAMMFVDEPMMTFELNGDTMSVAFDSFADAERAEHLWNTVAVDTLDRLTPSDRLLFDRLADAERFFDNMKSLGGNQVAEAASYLIAEGGFIAWLFKNAPAGAKDSAVTFVCSVAGLLASTICFCFLPPCWIVCIPALGVCLACSIAGIYDSLWDWVFGDDD